MSSTYGARNFINGVPAIFLVFFFFFPTTVWRGNSMVARVQIVDGCYAICPPLAGHFFFVLANGTISLRARARTQVAFPGNSA